MCVLLKDQNALESGMIYTEIETGKCANCHWCPVKDICKKPEKKTPWQEDYDKAIWELDKKYPTTLQPRELNDDP